jgi:hypothetical protein
MLRPGFVKVMLNDRPFQVPAEHAKKFIKKEQLVREAVSLQMLLKSGADLGGHRATLQDRLSQLSGKIIRLNRRIPPCAFSLEN